MKNTQQHTVLFLETISGTHSGLMLSWWHYAELTGMVSISAVFIFLTLILLPWRIWWAPNNANRWQVGFNLVFKGLILKVT